MHYFSNDVSGSSLVESGNFNRPASVLSKPYATENTESIDGAMNKSRLDRNVNQRPSD